MSGTTVVLYGIDAATAVTYYGYTGRLVGISDVLTGSPTLTTPANNAQITTTTYADLSFTAMTGATAYSTVVNTAADFTGTAATVTYPVYPYTTAAATVQAATTPGVTYYWMVRATAPVNSRYSAVWKFITALATTGGTNPTIVLPAQGALNVDPSPNFAWPAVAGATNYEFVIGEDPTFAIIDYSANSATNAFVSREPLLYGHTYYWRVRATSASSKGDWTVGVFTVMDKPATPVPPITIVPPPPTSIQVIEIPVTSPAQIPSYLLWIIIGIGAVLVIALIILIVRTRRTT
jgi:hypothetical protein